MATPFRFIWAEAQMRRAGCAEDGAGVGVGVTLPDRGTASALGGKQVCLFCLGTARKPRRVKGAEAKWIEKGEAGSQRACLALMPRVLSRGGT